MIKTYKYNDNIKLSEHFNSKEFRCKCGKSHTYKINSELVNKLEQLRSALNCSKIVLTSGYRCSTHDKNVGGTGKGQHTLGNACDCVLYDKNGVVIDTKLVSCKAQDLGFKGIANITKEYKYIHLDVRPSGQYFGNEIYGTYSVTNDFYKYYGIPREEKQTYQGVFPTLPSRGYFKRGDKGQQVKYLQMFLNWSNGSNLNVDGILGTNTLTEVKRFQNIVKINPDSLFGKQSLEKAKSYTK